MYIRIVQITKLGTAMPKVANIMMSLSSILPRLSAAMEPSGTPIRSESIIDIPPTLAETGNFEDII